MNENTDLKSPLVTILIITWNRKNDVLETLESLYEQTYKNFEIIVVDNGSTDGTVDAINQSYSDIRVVTLDQNKGVSVGRNEGISIAKGEIIFLLDSDASPGRDTLNNIVQKLQNEPGVGVINSKIVNALTKSLDGGPGWVYSSKMESLQNEEFFSYNFSEGGAAIRKEVLDKVGYFWDFLFFGCEGQELSLRVLDAGYKILYYPEAIVYHRASPYARINTVERDCNNMINSLSIYFVRYPWWMFIYLAPLKFLAILLRGIKRSYLFLVLKTLIVFLKKIPYLKTQRDPIRNDTAIYYLKMLQEQGFLSWNLFSWIKNKT